MKKIILIVSILLIVCGITPVFANQEETIIVNGKTYSLIEETESKSQNKAEEQSNYANEEESESIATKENKETNVEKKTSDNDRSVQRKSDNVLDSISKSKTKTALFIIVCIMSLVFLAYIWFEKGGLTTCYFILCLYLQLYL